MITFSSLDGGTEAFSWKYRYEKINNRIPPSPSARTKTRRFSKLTLFCFPEEWLTVESRCLFIFIWICEVILLLHPAAHSTSNVAMMNAALCQGNSQQPVPDYTNTQRLSTWRSSRFRNSLNAWITRFLAFWTMVVKTLQSIISIRCSISLWCDDCKGCSHLAHAKWMRVSSWKRALPSARKWFREPSLTAHLKSLSYLKKRQRSAISTLRLSLSTSLKWMKEETYFWPQNREMFCYFIVYLNLV